MPVDSRETGEKMISPTPARPRLAVVIIGQGYVGLPLAQAAVRVGHTVVGLDVSEELVASLNGGQSHVDDISSLELEEMLSLGYRATTDESAIAGANVVVICVPTPLGEDGGPDLSAVVAAGEAIGRHAQEGAVVILESTTYPGTTEDVLLPLLEHQGRRHGQDLFVAFSPERVNPGFPEHGIGNTPKLVGGLSPIATEKVVDFYRSFISDVIPLSGAKEAETAKLLENTYRHVNIALVNEMARFCHDLGVDIWEVIRGAGTKPFGFQTFTPGPGVGGHCIPIDPNYLSFQVKRTLGYQFKFVELAQEINNSMPRYVADRLADILNDGGLSVSGSRILLLGVTYKPDIADQRESPAVPVAKILLGKRARVEFHDFYVDNWNVGGQVLRSATNLLEAVEAADVVVLLQAHQQYDIAELVERSKRFFDTRGVTRGADVVRL